MTLTTRRMKMGRLSHSSSYHTTRSTRLASVRFCIGAMTCVGCNSRIERFLMDQRGVLRASASLLSSRCDVDYDADVLSSKGIEELIKSLGFDPVLVPDDWISAIVVHVGSEPERLDRAREILQETRGICAVKDVANDSLLQCDGTKSSVLHERESVSALLVQFDPQELGARAILQRLSAQLGVQLQATTPALRDGFDQQKEADNFRWLFGWSCVLCLPEVTLCCLLVVSSISSNLIQKRIIWGISVQNLVGFVSSSLILFGTALPIHARAASAIRLGSAITTDLLVSLGSCIAYGFSVINMLPMKVHTTGVGPHPNDWQQETLFEVTSFLLTLVLFAKWIESVVRARAVHTIDPLVDIQAKTAILVEKQDNVIVKESYVDAVLVERHDLLKVLPGARVPTDGIVVEGASSVDESMITGESRKVCKEPGSLLIGGSLNTQGVLIMRVTRIVSESMLARIIYLVDEAQTSKSRLQRIADKVSSILTTGTMVLALIMLVVWYLLASIHLVSSNGWSPAAFALRFAITILVISCPCAISLAVPTASLVAITAGSQHGLLIKGGHTLECLERVDVIMFDKTGTLTHGDLAVVEAYRVGLAPHSATDNSHAFVTKELWQLVATAEQRSEHAIARALRAHAQDHIKVQELQQETLKSFEETPGCGIQCEIESVESVAIAIGSPKWIENAVMKKSLPKNAKTRNDEFQAQGYTVVCVVINRNLEALIALKDRLRDESAFVVDQLKRRGVDPWIVTGDQKKSALAVARALGGVPDFHVVASAAPTEKVEKIRMLQSMGKTVAFVGDGTSDAPAMATSDIGIAIGATTEVALEWGDVVLIKGDLCDLLNALQLSKRTKRVIRWNLGWACLYNLTMIPLASGCLYPCLGLTISPAIAGLSELLSSVPIILFSLLLNLWRPKIRAAANDSFSVALDGVETTEETPLLLNRKHQ